MPYVDPWGGTVQGLKTLGDTFDTLEERRRLRENDALDMPYKRLRNEEAEVKLRTLRELDAENRANREARKAEETSLATATKETDVTNPDYQPPAPVTPLSAIKARARETAALGVDTGIPQEVSVGSLPTLPQAAVPGVGLPTMSGQRPMTDAEKNHARLQAAIQRGDMAAVDQMGKFIDISNKIDTQGMEKISVIMKAIDGVMNTLGPEAATIQARKWAEGMGMPPEQVASIKVSPKGMVSWLLPNGDTTVIIPDPDGKYHVVKSEGKKSTSQTDIEMAAAKGDPLATKVLADQEARKIRISKETKSIKPAAEKIFQFQERRAKESLLGKGIENPTVEQIAQERIKLFPKGVSKAPGRDPRAELKGETAGETKVINGKTYIKLNGKWYEK